MMIVNLYSGSHKTKYEKFNLIPNSIDGRFYGYCPWDDRVDLTRLGADKRADKVEGVTIIYTQKTLNPYEYEIIAFCDNATVYKKGIVDEKLQRFVDDEKSEHCSYSIESDTLVDLRNEVCKHKINAQGNILRGQRIYNEKKHSRIFEDVQSYIYSIYNEIEIFYEALNQEALYSDDELIGDHIGCFDKLTKCLKANGLLSLTRNATFARKALEMVGYVCEVNSNHKTFTHKSGHQYMEAHHLIPCYAEKNLNMQKKYGPWQIDQVGNIMSICPNCHRQIHSGNVAAKKSVIKILYDKRKNDLKKSGLKITINDLYALYNI